MVTTNGYTMSFAYDGLGRMSAGSFSNKLQTAYTYLAGASGGTTTTQVSGLKNTISGSTVAQNYQYQYDKLGNMTQVKDTVSNKTTDYAYDNQGQLLTAVSKSGSTVTRREAYTYDTYGNIHTASDGTTSHTYTYGDTEWLDLLTAYDGNAITYDAIGNPLSYYDGTAFTWTNGRQLQSLTKGNQTYSYEYDVNGLRTRKNKPDGTSIDYYIVDGQTIVERWNYANGSEYFTMRYVFDQNGSVIGFCTHYPGFPEGYFEHYLFAKNLQGDVVAMYTVGSGPPWPRSGEGHSAWRCRSMLVIPAFRCILPLFYPHWRPEALAGTGCLFLFASCILRYKPASILPIQPAHFLLSQEMAGFAFGA